MRTALLVLVVLAGSAGLGGADNSRKPLRIDDVTSSECMGVLQSGPSLDDPSVQTDPDRPIQEKAADDGDDQAQPGEPGYDDNNDQSDNDADGVCRSETLELRPPQDDGERVFALAPTKHALS